MGKIRDFVNNNFDLVFTIALAGDIVLIMLVLAVFCK